MIYYTDQNNNTYSVSATQISYRAIQPEKSSSGTYSGGTDREVNISEEQFKKINSLSERLFKDSSSHAERREMRTTILKKSKSLKEKKAILYPSDKRAEFEDILKKTLGL
ncbi:hypothetical protein SAMN04488104_104517 [Algoriphagus faecimaris]|uniref:Uncharacterized protein n=1 Tax=Algoriphagus faecimaris TaxID=686796 RepID=A0A1G6WML0_9BACT|nr:hypothetical protein [Algoriphagus faecimaris]SDD66275.1 hypothetical protein SAMN04488104_104517 [Algoriphagus faecimaris]